MLPIYLHVGSPNKLIPLRVGLGIHVFVTYIHTIQINISPNPFRVFFQTTQLGPLMIFLEFGLIVLTTSLPTRAAK